MAALERARRAGVGKVLAVSEDLESMERVLALKRENPGLVLAGLGIHPARSVAASGAELGRELAFIEANIAEADAVGEVGLDYKFAVTEEQQRSQADLLDRLFRIASAHGKPVNVHSRRAQRRAMELAIRYKTETGLNALMHWFTASKKLIRICAAEGIFVSAGPSVLSSESTREVAATIPVDLLLVETDSPVPFDGNPAEPALAADVTRALAPAFGVAPEELGRIVGRNFNRYLGRDGAAA